MSHADACGRGVAQSAHVAARAQRKRSRSGGMTSSRARPSPATSSPRTIAAGTPRALPSTSSAAPAISSRDGDLRRAQLVAGRVALPAQVEQHPDAGGADRDVRRPLAPRPPERVGHEHADRAAGQLAQPLPQPGGRRVGSRAGAARASPRRERSRRRRRPTRRRSRAASPRSRAARASARCARPRAGSPRRDADRPSSPASSRARSPGSRSASSTTRPSAFETTFWATTTTSPSSSAAAAAISAPRSSPAATSGSPVTGITRTLGHGRPVMRMPAAVR